MNDHSTEAVKSPAGTHRRYLTVVFAAIMVDPFLSDVLSVR